MNEDKTQELLLKLIEDMAVVKAKLDVVEEIKIDASKEWSNDAWFIDQENREFIKNDGNSPDLSGCFFCLVKPHENPF